MLHGLLRSRRGLTLAFGNRSCTPHDEPMRIELEENARDESQWKRSMKAPHLIGTVE